MDDLWEILEYVGEALVFFGVVGEVFAEWSEPHRKRLGRISSLVLIGGLGLALAALIRTNGNFNGKIADLNAHAAASELDAANARKETQALRLKADNAELELARLIGPPYDIPVIRGTATPDLSHGFIQRVLLTGDTRIIRPALPSMANGGSISWTLLLDQDSKGGHKFTISFASLPNMVLALDPHSRCTFEYITDTDGATSLRGLPWLNSPIPKTPVKK